jgi:hypothetical protein
MKDTNEKLKAIVEISTAKLDRNRKKREKG